MKTGIMTIVIAVALMATVQTVAGEGFDARGNVTYENGTTFPYGATGQIWNLNHPEYEGQPWTFTTQSCMPLWDPVDYVKSGEYGGVDDLIKVRVTSPDGTYVGVNISRWGDVRDEGLAQTRMNVTMHVNAKRGTCYEDTLGEGTVVSENLSCSECFALPTSAGANSWKNYEFESQCNPGYTVPRYVFNATDPCPQCCDGINNNDGDSYIDWSETDAGDPECGCPLDDSESVGGCPAPCVPEVATVAMIGIGLMMLVGLIRYRRT